MHYQVVYSNQFKRDLKAARKQGHDLKKLFYAIDSLRSGELLPPKFHDHALGGRYTSYRECHIEPDWLLVYKRNDSLLTLILYRVGTHSELF